MPMLRAVPSMIRIAESIVCALRSTSLVCAISRTCCFVTLPILSLCGTADALAIPAALEHGLGIGHRGAGRRVAHGVVAALGRARVRLVARADEAVVVRRAAPEVQRVVGQLYLLLHVAGVDLLLRTELLLVADLDDL